MGKKHTKIQASLNIHRLNLHYSIEVLHASTLDEKDTRLKIFHSLLIRANKILNRPSFLMYAAFIWKEKLFFIFEGTVQNTNMEIQSSELTEADILVFLTNKFSEAGIIFDNFFKIHANNPAQLENSSDYEIAHSYYNNLLTLFKLKHSINETSKMIIKSAPDRLLKSSDLVHTISNVEQQSRLIDFLINDTLEKKDCSNMSIINTEVLYWIKNQQKHPILTMECIEELIKILECKNRNQHQTIINEINAIVVSGYFKIVKNIAMNMGSTANEQYKHLFIYDLLSFYGMISQEPSSRKVSKKRYKEKLLSRKKRLTNTERALSEENLVKSNYIRKFLAPDTDNQ